MGTEHAVEEFQQFSMKTAHIGGVLEAIKYFVIEKGQKTGCTHGLVLNRDTGLVMHYLTNMHPTEINGNDAVNEMLENPDNNFAIHHNHPKNTPLSICDVYSLAMPGLKQVVAHGHDGRYSSASLTADVRRKIAEENLDRADTTDLLRSIYREVKFYTAFALKSLLSPCDFMLDNTLLQELQEIYLEAAHRGMAGIGMIDYVFLHGTDHINMTVYDEIQNEAVTHATKELKHKGRSWIKYYRTCN